MKKIILITILLIGINTGIHAYDVDGISDKCDRGDNLSCYTMGHMYMLGDGVERDLNKAKMYHARLCDSGDPSYTNSCQTLQIIQIMLDSGTPVSAPAQKQHTQSESESDFKDKVLKLQESSGYYKPVKSLPEKKQPTGKTIIARGVIIFATLDSAIEINDGDSSIGFLTDSEIGDKIFSICKVGEYCEITGVVNNEFFLSVSKVQTALPR